MPGFLMHVAAMIQCFHAAPARPTPTQGRVFVSGGPVLVMRDQIAVQGCLFTAPGPKPQPCVLVKWQMPSTRVFIDKQPAMLIPTPGLGPAICQSAEQIPQGVPMVGGIQTRVFAV